MKKERIILIIFAVLVAAFLWNFISAHIEEGKKFPVLQHIEEARITVKAAPFQKENIEETSDNPFKGLYFSSSYKKIMFSLTYAVYDKERDLFSAVETLKEIFKDYNLEYSTIETEISGALALKFSGRYEKDGKKYEVEEVLIKKDKHLWQILTIYPYLPANKKYINLAQDYINSITLDEF
ncbi:MAG: hypothetical protein LBO62_07515 [Endomicrobium sp.]|jgi:hypothetical protein|nr:hypothetical protein [Endomicrobium sp.]